MSRNIFSDAARLSDRELIARVQFLAHREREATATLIAHLVVLEERRLYLAEGCSSMFTYCTQVLHLSESAAYRRIEAARAARKYPEILDMLSDGSVSLTTIVLLAPELTPANHREILTAAKHQSKRQVEEIVARLRPQPLLPSTVRRLPTSSNGPVSTMALAAAPAFQSAATSPPTPTQPLARPAVVPTAPERYKVQFTASADMHAKLRRAQDLLRHQIPDGDLGKVLDVALTVLIKSLEREKIGATDRPRTSRATAVHSRHIPAEVKRAVWTRDAGRCAFVSQDGRRCTEHGFLEFHHVIPYSAGGKATVDNIELRCRAHNGYEAYLDFGSTRSGPNPVR